MRGRGRGGCADDEDDEMDERDPRMKVEMEKDKVYEFLDKMKKKNMNGFFTVWF